MKSNQILVAVLLLLASTFACKPRQSAFRLSGSSQDSSGTKVFFDGLHAAPGSPERLAAAKLFRDALTPSISEMEQRGEKTHEMLRVVLMTLEYLEGKNICKPEERVTLYRGFGRHPIYRPKNSKAPGFMFNNVWMQNTISEILTLQKTIGFEKRVVTPDKSDGMPTITGDDIGNVIFDNSHLLKNLDLKSVDWKSDLFDYDWYSLSTNHSFGEADPDVLISLTVLPEIARRFGPGYLTLSLCPERAQFLVRTDNYTEFEMYVPFFILPEEIARIDGIECGQLKDDEGKASKRCFKKTTGKEFADFTTQINELTKIYRQCFVNFGTLAEAAMGNLLADRYALGGEDTFYKVLSGSKDNLEFRSQLLPALKAACRPDCKLAKSIKLQLESKIAEGAELVFAPEEIKSGLKALNDSIAGCDN